MKALGKIAAGLLMLDGGNALLWPRAYLKFWDSEWMPEVVRRHAHPYLGLPDSTLRSLGLMEVLLAAMIAALADRVQE